MRTKKILSLAVVLAMVLTVMPMFGLTASAAEAVTSMPSDAEIVFNGGRYGEGNYQGVPKDKTNDNNVLTQAAEAPWNKFFTTEKGNDGLTNLHLYEISDTIKKDEVFLQMYVNGQSHSGDWTPGTAPVTQMLTNKNDAFAKGSEWFAVQFFLNRDIANMIRDIGIVDADGKTITAFEYHKEKDIMSFLTAPRVYDNVGGKAGKKISGADSYSNPHARWITIFVKNLPSENKYTVTYGASEQDADYTTDDNVTKNWTEIITLEYDGIANGFSGLKQAFVKVSGWSNLRLGGLRVTASTTKLETTDVTISYKDGEEAVGTEKVTETIGATYTPYIGDYYVGKDSGYLYKVGEVGSPITVSKDATIEIPVTKYKKLAEGSPNKITNGDFESGRDNWTEDEAASAWFEVKKVDFGGINTTNVLYSKSNSWKSHVECAIGGVRSFQKVVPVESGKKYYYSIDVFTGLPSGLYMNYAFIKEGDPMSYGSNERGEDTNALTQNLYVTEGAQTNCTPENSCANGEKLSENYKYQWHRFEGVVTADDVSKAFEFDVYYLHDSPGSMIDNVAFYEVSDLDDDVNYEIVYTTDGTESGAEVARSGKMEGKVGSTLNIEKATTVVNKRSGKSYYSNKEDKTTTLTKDKTTYYVGCDLVATITGPSSIDIATIAGYNYVLPATIKTTVDNGAVTAEELPVTWEGTTGTIADTGLALKANVTTHEKTFDPIAGMTVGSNSVINNQSRAFREMYRFPKEISDQFTVAFTLVAKGKGDNAVGFFKYDAKGENAYGSNLRIHLPIDGDKIYYRDSADKKEFMTMELNQSYTFILDVNVTNSTYDLSVRNDSTGEGRILFDISFRNKGGIDGVSFFGNNPSKEGDLEISKFAVYAEGVEVPEAASLTARLGFATDGDNKDSLGITFTAGGAYDGQTLKVTAIDLHQTTDSKGGKGVDNTTIDTSVLSDGTPSVLVIPKTGNGSNIYYMARLFDTNSGYLIAQAEASLYELLANDIKANLSSYKDASNREKFDATRLEKAIAILSTGGIVLDDKNTINDVRKEFITVTSSEAGTMIELDKALCDNGIGFKVSTIVDVNGTQKTATKAEGLFYKITINDNIVTCEGVDGVMIFSLDSVEIEFVSTEVAEIEADSTGAEVDFIPEL